MTILFLVKFFQPFDRGGSEIRTYELARSLVKNGDRVNIITPNYGAKATEIVEGIKIFRMPFPIKLKNSKDQIAPFWTNNITWFLFSTIYCIYICLKEDAKIIHAQNNEFIPAAAITSFLLKKKSIVTFRDYQSICPLGFCLWNNQ